MFIFNKNIEFKTIPNLSTSTTRNADKNSKNSDFAHALRFNSFRKE